MSNLLKSLEKEMYEVRMAQLELNEMKKHLTAIGTPGKVFEKANYYLEEYWHTLTVKYADEEINDEYWWRKSDEY